MTVCLCGCGCVCVWGGLVSLCEAWDCVRVWGGPVGLDWGGPCVCVKIYACSFEEWTMCVFSDIFTCATLCLTVSERLVPVSETPDRLTNVQFGDWRLPWPSKVPIYLGSSKILNYFRVRVLKKKIDAVLKEKGTKKSFLVPQKNILQNPLMLLLFVF